MKTFIRNNYIVGLLIIIFVGFVLYSGYNYTQHNLREQVQENIDVHLRLKSSDIKNEFTANMGVVREIAAFIHDGKEDQEILRYLTSRLAHEQKFSSLYYGTPDNKLLNGSGWQPPAEFDLRERPWYIKAVAEQKTIATEPYLNATRDSWIVTLAAPVYDAKYELLGVVGGDSSVQELLDFMQVLKPTDNSVVFFLDSNRDVIMHSQHQELHTDLQLRQELSQALTEEISGNSGFVYTYSDQDKGYLAWNTIDSIGWLVGVFVPDKDFINVERQVVFIVVSILTILGIFMAYIFVYQRKKVISPLLELDEDIQKIAISQNISYRLPAAEQDMFFTTRQAINEVLDNTQKYFLEMNNTQRELEEANMAKSNFLANMSHEIRTPLNSILGMIEVLEEKKIAGEDYEVIEVLQRNSDSLLQIVNDVLNISRIETGQIQARPEVFKPWQLLKELKQALEPHVKKKDLDFKVINSSTTDEELTIRSDKLKVRQILIKLISNAIKFTHEGSITLKIETDKQRKLVRLTVSDTGIGISENKLLHIFDNFEQVESGARREFGGSGLGLAISKGLSGLIDSKLYVESVIGKGSEFHLEIPLTEYDFFINKKLLGSESLDMIQADLEERTQAVSNVEQESSDEIKKILLVEDNKDNRNLVLVFLKNQPVQIDIAVNGVEAVELFSKNYNSEQNKSNYDVVLMDIQMPIMDGLEATQRIRQLEREKGMQKTDIVALTAYAMEEDQVRCIKAGCDDHVSKPIKKKKLLEIIGLC